MDSLPHGPRSLLRVNLQSIFDPIGTAERLRSEYGDPISLPMPGGKPFLLTGSQAGIRAIFSAPPENLETFDEKALGAIVGSESLLALSGGRHAALRKLLLPPFHGQRMRVYGRQICALTREQTRDFKPGRLFIVQELMHAISLQTIIQLVFGVTAPERIAAVTKLIHEYRAAFSSPLLVFPILIPWLQREFWGVGPWARLQRSLRALRAFFAPELARCRGEGAVRTDILSLLVAARHEDGTGLSEPQIFDQLQTLLLAGHATTADTLAWALYFLAREPQVMKRLQAELAALGPDAEPETLAQLPFLEAVCQETLRLRPTISSAARRLRGPLHIAGYELPAGGYVGASILWAHNNPEVFPEPERFLPERFLHRTYSPFEFLPFGGGQRRCIGAAFAMYEMKLVLATLLQHFRFALVSAKPVRVVQRTTLVPSAPIRMIVHPASG